MTQNEFCRGKIVQSVNIFSRGAYEGCTGTIGFTDGTVLEISDDIFAVIDGSIIDLEEN